MLSKKSKTIGYIPRAKFLIVPGHEAVEDNSEVARECGLSKSIVQHWRRDQATVLSGELKMSAKHA